MYVQLNCTHENNPNPTGIHQVWEIGWNDDGSEPASIQSCDNYQVVASIDGTYTGNDNVNFYALTGNGTITGVTGLRGVAVRAHMYNDASWWWSLNNIDNLDFVVTSAAQTVNIELVASMADHGAAGELGLNVNLTAQTLPDDSALVTTESREAGISKLLIDCDGDVTLPDPPESLVASIVGVNNGDVTANVLSVTAAADVITIDLTPLPDEDTYTVTLTSSVIAGDNDFLIRALRGEVDNGGGSSQVVNALDLSDVRQKFTADVTVGDNAKYDIVSDGTINALDLSECRIMFTHSAP